MHYPEVIIRSKLSEDEILNLIIEVTGQKKKEKEAEVATARDFWVPAVNNHGGFGKWAFLEILDPWNTKTEIREILKSSRIYDE